MDLSGRANHRSRIDRDDPLRAIAWAVRSRRKALGLSQAELANLAGCGQPFVSSLERAKPTLRVDKLMDVLAVLNYTIAVADLPRTTEPETGSGT